MALVSYFVDQSNRAAFVNKKVSGLSPSLCVSLACISDALQLPQIITVLAKQREATLLKQKEDQENLIFSIFPKQVAQELISARSKEGGDLMSGPKGSLKHLVSFGSSIARLHRNVTILFTDIVGFTAMSQTCQPFEVMHFLHNLFVDFDDLIEMDSQLWKVETIGDAFMVASGLNVDVNLQESSTQTSSSPSILVSSRAKSASAIVSCKSANAFSSAKAAIDFGMAALREARLHTMPNNEPCRIRVGAHTGEVCSGVIGNRMPRYCLFGDTVNTASRMESTGVINSIQVSETTRDILVAVRDHDAFILGAGGR